MESREKTSNLFKYIRELYAQRNQVVTDIKNQEWYKFINDIPIDDDNIILNFFDRTELLQDDFSPTILSITKPEFEKVPSLPTTLEKWIEGDWTRFDKDIKVKESITSIRDEEKVEIFFTDDQQRIKDLKQWQELRNIWCSRQKNIEIIRNLFNEVYKEYIDLERNSESFELMLGQGILECKTNNDSRVFHPVLLKRVSIKFESKYNKIIIQDNDSIPEIYTFLFQDIDYINHSAIKDLKDELSEYMYHPLDRNDTPDFLKSFVHKLHEKSNFISESSKRNADDKVVIYNNPVLFKRKRTGGVIKALDDIVNHINQGAMLSAPLLNLIGENVSQYIENNEQLDLNQSLAAINGEDKNILLSKEANKEQLEVAKQIENYNAVLVQGPPGTGKTHTIANLMGHFLAQGKNILVTSHTKKALNVVKDKVVPELQNLCVSVLDDNNLDMERSIDGITEYLSSHTSSELFEIAEELKKQREELLQELSQIRTKLYAIKHKEYETIAFGGEAYTMSEAAKFVNDYKERLSYIPGKVLLNKPLPLSVEDLEKLYRINEYLSIEEENELVYPIPDYSLLISPTDFQKQIENYNIKVDLINKLVKELNHRVIVDVNEGTFKFDNKVIVNNFDKTKINQIDSLLVNDRGINRSKWQLKAILDGKNGAGYREIWYELINAIKDANQFSGEIVLSTFGKKINTTISVNEDIIHILNEIKSHLDNGKKLSSFSLLLHKEWKNVLENIKINDKKIETSEDCTVLIQLIQLKLKRQKIENLWNELVEKNDGESTSIFGEEIEQGCIRYIPQIEFCLNWYLEVYQNIDTLLGESGIEYSYFIERKEHLLPIEEINETVSFIYNELPQYIKLIKVVCFELPQIENKIESSLAVLKKNELVGSLLCNRLILKLIEKDYDGYLREYLVLQNLNQKQFYYDERQKYLKEIEKFAPEWANVIRKRIGIHGEYYIPDNIQQAWLWKQFSGIIDEITAQPFEELQLKSVSLNKTLRKSTSKLAEALAWGYLLERIEKDTRKKQDLQGWKLTTKRIGKGTGKTAPNLKREAQRLMANCQSAVPAWIMPINKALESLDIAKNKFDIVIIDEASQADISALAIMYLAKKIIIVGDDEQVSPSAVGLDMDKVSNLSDMYIKGSIPNSHLYDMKSSLYDIAKTTFPTLMLKEHFRCVPSIIGYSNRLCYDYKIKPLRDDSQVPIKPATVAYRVNGSRDGRKRNIEEANAVVSLILACMKQPEYDGMTFGIISLLGDEQVKLINSLCIEKIPPQDYEKRRILCGNASQFQGDERDVIFISLVDSNEGTGPIRLVGEGVGKSIKQRYNVAASRAKNQLWVVHSLDINNDLKPGDMRKDLIEYVTNPLAFDKQLEKIKAKADSPFEVSVASELVKNGYHIVQQLAVGAYRIDMVAVYGDKKIAIECDGELYHSGEDKVREDMERQAILERIGWKFIRIRGSEYYKDRNTTINRVVKELKNYGIEPGGNNNIIEFNKDELKERVIIEAAKIYDHLK